jgi:hypothetical protein
VTGSKTYTATGLYTVTLTVTGANSTSANSTYQYVVVIDPLAGSEMGAGAINSPAGSYTANPTAAFQSNITQLVAKYGADGTLGALTNVFKFSYVSAPNYTFSSTTMKWLVKSGSKSWLKGEGWSNVNGVNEAAYFLVSVVDSNIVADKVRVKIWSKATGKVIYDNQKDAFGNSPPDDAVATTLAASGAATILFSK